MNTKQATLQDLAQEYLANIEVMENRVIELEKELRHTRKMQQVFLLRKRIYRLKQMINENRYTCFRMQHYYDKPKEESETYVKTYKPKRRGSDGSGNCKFRSSGYGNPAPAAAVGRGKSRCITVSGICVSFSGRNAAKHNR